MIHRRLGSFVQHTADQGFESNRLILSEHFSLWNLSGSQRFLLESLQNRKQMNCLWIFVDNGECLRKLEQEVIFFIPPRYTLGLRKQTCRNFGVSHIAFSGRCERRLYVEWCEQWTRCGLTLDFKSSGLSLGTSSVQLPETTQTFKGCRWKAESSSH